MKIRVAFYKYNKKFINAAISIWTWPFNIFTPGYSHVELGIFFEDGWKYFSSTTRGGAKGTRWIKSADLFKHPERWDIFEIEVYSVDVIVDRANAVLGQPYDFIGLFGFVLPFGFLNKRNKWYCSEVIILAITGIWKKIISPRRLYSYLKKEFYPRRMP